MSNFGEYMFEIEQPGLCERYISAAWADLAAVAWYEYLARGRGMLYLDFSTMAVVRLDEIIVDVVYVPVEEIIASSIEVGINPDLCASLVDAAYSYEPTERLIAVSKMPDGSFLDYYVGREPSPPEAFLRLAIGSAPDRTIPAIIN